MLWLITMFEVLCWDPRCRDLMSFQVMITTWWNEVNVNYNVLQVDSNKLVDLWDCWSLLRSWSNVLECWYLIVIFWSTWFQDVIFLCIEVSVVKFSVYICTLGVNLTKIFEWRWLHLECSCMMYNVLVTNASHWFSYLPLKYPAATNVPIILVTVRFKECDNVCNELPLLPGTTPTWPLFPNLLMAPGGAKFQDKYRRCGPHIDK